MAHVDETRTARADAAERWWMTSIADSRVAGRTRSKSARRRVDNGENIQEGSGSRRWTRCNQLLRLPRGSAKKKERAPAGAYSWAQASANHHRPIHRPATIVRMSTNCDVAWKMIPTADTVACRHPACVKPNARTDAVRACCSSAPSERAVRARAVRACCSSALLSGAVRVCC